MENLDFLVEDAEQQAKQADNTVTLNRLSLKVNRLENLKRDIETVENTLEKLKKEYTKLSQEEIPELFNIIGIDSITVAGKKVTVTQDLSASVKDMPSFIQFLEDRGDASIVKTDMSFGKLDPSITRRCQTILAESFGLYPEVKNTIHPATLKKYIKDITGLNKKDCEVPIAELPDSVKVFVYYKTVVK